jgi:hypothetical protein
MHSITRIVRSTASSPSCSLALAGPLALLLAACPGNEVTDDAGAADTIDTEAAADNEAGTGTTSAGESGTDGGHGPRPEKIPTADDTSSSTTAPTDDTIGEPPAEGSCVGYTSVGYVGVVLSRGGVPIDLACDSTPAPCGGDPVDGWALAAVCGFEDLPNPFAGRCPGSTYETEILSQSGTMTFAADGTVVQDFDIVLEIVLTVDSMACFDMSCADLQAVFEASNPEGSPPPTCEAIGANCECTFPDDGQPEQAMASWEVVGTDLLITAEGVTTVFPICVTEDRLDLWQAQYDPPVPTGVACSTQQDCIDALGDTYDLYACALGDDPFVAMARSGPLRVLAW